MKLDLLFNGITAIHPSLLGWCDLDKAHALAAAVVTLRPAIIVEIGVFGGKSLIPMALALQQCGGGVAWAIDPWSNVAAAEGYDGVHAEWWGHVPIEDIYNGFVATLKKLDLERFVQIHRKKSDEVEPPADIDLLHIDGQHTDQAIRDVTRFASKVRAGGLCVMDDIAWTNGTDGQGGVGQAVKELLRLGFRQLYPLGTGAVFQITPWLQ